MNINYLSMIKKFVYLLRKKIRKFEVFETEVGVKYQFGRFDSERLSDFALEEISMVHSGLTFSDLLLPPDLLRNRFTQCGKPLTASIHYRLMQEIGTGSLTPASEYVTSSSQGILDARLPARLSLDFLAQRYKILEEKLDQHENLTISAMRIGLKDKPSYIILDGKHRAAFLANKNLVENLKIQLVSRDFASSDFFRKVYSFILGLDPGDYSINQKMIKEILDE